jgi:dihydrofolate synthase / folylpolyglutamate synthase
MKFKVGHFSSPHIFEFNERFWLDGEILSDKTLERAHCSLARLIKDDLQNLSYFEYAAFLAALAFRNCDFIVFEAGLGGEYDATSVFEKKLSVFVPIDYDHTQILGENLLDIARTKLKVMGAKALISGGQDERVLNLARKIALLKNSKLYECDKIELLNEANLAKAYKSYVKKQKLPNFLQENLKTALCAINLLDDLPNLQRNLLKAIKKLPPLDLRGRCEQISPNIFIDVGHNEMAAKALAQHFAGRKFVVIYNCFLDKNFLHILRNLKPLIAKIALYVYPSQRKLATQQIKAAAKALDIECEDFKGIAKGENYLVFGSFVLVENFLRDYDKATKI